MGVPLFQKLELNYIQTVLNVDITGIIHNVTNGVGDSFCCFLHLFVGVILIVVWFFVIAKFPKVINMVTYCMIVLRGRANWLGPLELVKTGWANKRSYSLFERRYALSWFSLYGEWSLYCLCLVSLFLNVPEILELFHAYKKICKLILFHCARHLIRIDYPINRRKVEKK